MRKTPSKSEKREKNDKLEKREKREKRLKLEKADRHEKRERRRLSRKNRHVSFKRSYKEDYERELEVPGLLYHAMSTFKVIFKNWRIFLLFILLIILLNIILVGIMNEETYVQFQNSLDESMEGLKSGAINQVGRAGLLLLSTITTGGLTQGMSEVQQVFATILFIIIWLCTIYILRYYLAGHKVKLRDALYNALTPFISTLIVALLIFVEMIPILITLIVYSAAVATDFLATPFYAFVFFVFAVLMILLSLYLVSSSSIALIAVSAPGLYPFVAIETANDLVTSRRIRWILRLLYLIPVMAVCWVVVMLPCILLDLWLKSSFSWLQGFPFISLVLLFMTVFTIIYVTTYMYLFYRRMLDYDDESVLKAKHDEEGFKVVAEKKAPKTKKVTVSRKKNGK